MKFLRSISILILLATLGCSANYKFNKANRAYLKSSYEEAIKKYDHFLENGINTALHTQAELERSDCYYQLGYAQFQLKNWELASRYLYLANSTIADSFLDVCYNNLAKNALAKHDTLTALEYYSYIIDFLPNSSVYYDVIASRLKLKAHQKEYASAFKDYQLLCSEAMNSSQRTEIQPIIDGFMPILQQQVAIKKANEQYEAAVKELLQYTKYPLAQHDEIIAEICHLYFILAEIEFSKTSYRSCKNYLDKVKETCSAQIDAVDLRIEEICTQLITEGDQLKSQLEFNEALKKYEVCFVFKENDNFTQEKIDFALQEKSKYEKSVVFEKEGSQFEEEKDYKSALQSYQKANSFFSSEGIRNKVFRMQNMIEAEKDPKGFALRIVRNFKNGILLDHLEILKQNMYTKYGQYTSFSDWKVTYAIGGYKYEVRYDVLSPEETFYFAWRVDLVTQKVTPSNRVSEELMTSGNIMKHQKQE